MRKTEFEQYLKLTQPERANSLVLVDQQHKTEEQNINKTISSGQHISHIDKTKMRIAVIGGGAMGSLVSHKLANQGGFQVTLITSWQEQVNAVNKKGWFEKVFIRKIELSTKLWVILEIEKINGLSTHRSQISS